MRFHDPGKTVPTTMLRTTSYRALIIPFLAAAFVMAMPSVHAQTPTQDPNIAALNAILQSYATEEGATTTATVSRTTLTASADDLVAAVYQQFLNRPLTDQQVADMAAAALKSPDGVKVRADKDKVAPRILEAAIIARGAQSNGALIGLLVSAVANANNTLPPAKQLTAAGKEAVIGKALAATSGQGAALAGVAKTLSAVAGGATVAPDVKLTTFADAALKTLTYKPQVYDPALASTSQATDATKGRLVQLYNGAPEPVIGLPLFDPHGVPPAIAGVRDFVDALLDDYSVVTPAGKTANALKLAEGVATLPAVAGAVIGGLVQDQQTAGVPDTAATAGTPSLQGIIAQAISDTRLATAIADIVDNGLSLFGRTTDKVAAATALATGQTAVNKGKVASGAVRADNTDATAIINGILGIADNKAVAQAGLAAFATAAATGNGDPGTAKAISNAVIAKLAVKPTPAADLTAIQGIAINVIKAVAPANPDSAFDVAQGLFGVQRNGVTVNPYSTAAARSQLASDLAKGAATNYTAAGAAVSGVVEKAISLDTTAGLDVAISAAAIKVAAKASLSIAQKVSQHRGYSGSTALSFASGLALSSASTNAGAIAAGVALTDTSDAGDIVKAVITANGSQTAPPAQLAALNKAAASIANTAAINVDVEAIADIAQKVGSLYQPKGSANKNLPQLSTLGTLATSLAKAINTKPLVTQSNRVDELGELAAVLVTDSLGIAGGNTPAALAAIGTSIYKAASAKLLADTGNNAADLKDIAGDVAGAIAQTIALAPPPVNGVGGLTPAEKTALLTGSGTGSLIKLLTTAAKTFAAQVSGNPNAAFDRVLSTQIGTGTGIFVTPYVSPNAADNEPIGRNNVVLFTGQYEIGAIVDNETPTKNL